MNDLIIISAFMLTNSDLLVETNYGPLFLDEDDFEMFEFNPYYIIDAIDTDEVKQLMIKIKQYYIDEAIKLIVKGEI